MRFLVIGLGSMGKRRVRCLRALDLHDIIGVDLRADRRKEAESLYGIRTAATLDEAAVGVRDAIIVSTPPDHHDPFLRLAIQHGKPAFVEASVIMENLPSISEAAKRLQLVVSPSCTLRFHPAIRDIKEIVTSERYGKVTNFSYHSGQYLPDWHPWEQVTDYYVSRKETGACREIVPFELTWMVDVFGWPTGVRGFRGRTMDVGADIDDTYAVSLQFPGCFGLLLVDVVARSAVRHLSLNLEYGQVIWDWNAGQVRLFDAVRRRWVIYQQGEQQAHVGYNKNIIEQMYIDEIASFVRAVRGEAPFPNTLDDDIRVLNILHKFEEATQ